ncbi:MAG: extracellular solute-binding protein [Chloroflexi bacterium]|nr:extracellular solute-binding protein [Chloroflexota bacterium]
MSGKRLTRRSLLRNALFGSAGLALAACAPKVIKETVVVEKPVEKIVKETVVVKEAVEVEKEVTRVVEKQVKAPEEPITLIIQHPHPSYEKFGETTADPQFEERHPNVKIKREFTAGYVKEFYPKLMTMHVGGVSWDVAELPSWAGTEYVLYLKGVLKELTPFVERDKFDLDVFFPIAIKGSKFRGMALFMLPILVDPGQCVLLYNKDALDEAGVPEPTLDWRYDREFLDVLAKLHEKFGDDKWTWSPQVTGTFGYQAALDAWNTSLLDETARKLLLDEPKGKACMKYYYDLFESGNVPRAGEMPGGAGQMWTGGQLIFETTFPPVVPWRFKAVDESGNKFNYNATLMPKGPEPDGKHGGSANPHYMGMGSNSKHPDMAWEYLKWFTGEELADPLWDAGLVPARVATWEKRVQDAHPIWKMSMELLYSVDLTFVPWNFRGGEVEDALVNGMGRVWLGEVGFEQGLAETAEKIRQILDKPMA